MSDTSILSLRMAEPDIAVLTFDDPNKGANVLSRPVLEEFEKLLDECDAIDGLAGLVIRSGKPGMFIAGADLREFAAEFDNATTEKTIEMCTRGRQLFQRMSKCSYTTVTAIDGLCVGGGAELCIWADRRIFSDDSKAQFGFPEVKIGLYPGWGGTARTPRIVGLSNAVEMVTGGENVDGKAAALMNLATDCVPRERIEQAAIDLVRAEQQSGDYLKDRELWSGPIEISDTELTFLGATASAVITQTTKGQYPAPMAALETMLGAASLDIDAACEAEAEGMADLFASPINRSLVNIFFLTDRNKKDRGVEGDVAPQDIKTVSVIGAGIMGAGIAAANVKRKLPVALSDAMPESLAKGVQTVLEEVSYNKETKSTDVDRAMQFAPMVNATTSDTEIAASDLVIEAIIENADIKKQLYTRLEPQMRDDAILGSNTSTIPITSLASELKRPENFCGIHFFNPVRRMKLVEVIRGEKTSDETVATAVAYSKQIGKMPIVVNDGPGFLVNRLLLPYMGEAIELLHDGVDVKRLDRLATGFGMPMGPITLYDVVGLDTCFYAGRVMVEAFPDRIVASPLVGRLIKAGRLGQKSGAGFYKYDASKKKKKGELDPALTEFVEPLNREPQELDDQTATMRLFLPMLVEATRVLEEKLVRDVRDVDLGLIFGIGFPPFRGGLLSWADTLGAAKIVETLKPFESLGKRYEATPLLLEMAKDGRKFYDLSL